MPALIGSGSSDRLQVAHSGWLNSVVWSPDVAEYGFLRPGIAQKLSMPLRETPAPTPAPTPEPTPEPTATPAPTPEPWATMVVRPGDTISDLAYWFGIKPGDIASVNGLGIGDYVVAGATLVIPIPLSQFVPPPEPVVLVVPEEPIATPEPATPEPDPTPAPTPPPTPTPTPFTGTSDEVIEAICSLPWPCETMVRVAMCESGLNPNAYNPAGYYGLFQINYKFDGWNDPWINSQVAYEQKYLPAVQGGGTGLEPWPVCGNY